MISEIMNMNKVTQTVQAKKDIRRENQKTTVNKMKASQSGGDYKKSLKLQTSIPRAARHSQTASPTTSIPSSYLKMLDIRIAELESVTGMSFPSLQSPVLSTPANASGRRNKAIESPIVPTCSEKSMNDLSMNSEEETGSLAIERYLKDDTEADGV